MTPKRFGILVDHLVKVIPEPFKSLFVFFEKMPLDNIL